VISREGKIAVESHRRRGQSLPPSRGEEFRRKKDHPTKVPKVYGVKKRKISRQQGGTNSSFWVELVGRKGEIQDGYYLLGLRNTLLEDV